MTSRARVAKWWLAVMAPLVCGCHSSTAPRPKTTTSKDSTTTVADMYAAAAQIPDSLEGEPDRTYLALQRRVPGFGGLFIDRDGTPTVYLTDTTQRAAVAEPVSALVGGVRMARGGVLRILRGDYDWRSLKVWHRMVDGTLWSSGRIVYTDADEARNRLVIGVVDSAAVEEVMRAVARLGIPSKAVVTMVMPAPRATRALTDFNRPLIPGTRTIQLLGDGHLATCSIGFTTSGFGGATFRGFLTASHCTRNPRANDSTQFFQPSYGAHEIADLKVVDPPYGLPPLLGSRTSACRRSDIALEHLDDSVSSTFAQVAAVDNGVTLGSTPYDVVSTDYDAKHIIVGAVMDKIGEATGHTSGVVAATGITTIETMVLPTGQSIAECLSQQVAVVVDTPPAAKSGDSGGPVFANRGFPAVEAEGIVWGVSSTKVPDDTYLFSSLNGFKTDAGGLEPVLH